MLTRKILKVVLPLAALLALSLAAVLGIGGDTTPAEAHSSTLQEIEQNDVVEPNAASGDPLLKIETNSPQQIGTPIVFTATVIGGAFIDFQFTWDFGDGTTARGQVVEHIYPTTGHYIVNVIAVDGFGVTLQASEVVDIVPIPTPMPEAPEPITGLQITSNSPTEEGNPTNFIATVDTGTDVIFQWEFGDGKRATGASVSHTYAQPGAYTVLLEATNRLGSTRAQAVAVVTQAPLKGLSVEYEPPVLAGVYEPFTATVSVGSNVQYAWSFGDGTALYVDDGATDAGSRVYHKYEAPGTYELVIVASRGHEQLRITEQVRVEPSPVGNITVVDNSPQLAGADITFAAEVQGNAEAVVYWEFGNGKNSPMDRYRSTNTIKIGELVTHRHNSPGLYPVLVTAQGAAGAVQQSAVAIVKASGPFLPKINVSVSDPVSLPGENVALSVLQPNANWNYTWEHQESSSTGTGTNFTLSFASPGNKYVKVSATENGTDTVIAEGYGLVIVRDEVLRLPTICMPNSLLCLIPIPGGASEFVPTPTPPPAPSATATPTAMPTATATVEEPPEGAATNTPVAPTAEPTAAAETATPTPTVLPPTPQPPTATPTATPTSDSNGTIPPPPGGTIPLPTGAE